MAAVIANYITNQGHGHAGLEKDRFYNYFVIQLGNVTEGFITLL
jgi:hypothetical protein